MKLTGFAFGIRTVRSFSIEDRLGAIVDEILYCADSEFNEKLFPEVRENHNTKILYDPINHNKFTITPQDFIFEYNIKSSFEQEFDKYLKSYVSVLTKKIFKEYKIKNIARFGFIIKSELSEKDKFLKDISSIIEKHKGSDDSLSLRFNVVTKKPLKLQEIITEDYDNEIVTYDKLKASSPLNHSVDFQKYFKPELNIIEDATQDFETFCLNTYKVFEKSYLGNNEKK
jgi:polyphosphate kinase